MQNSFDTLGSLNVGGQRFAIHRLDRLPVDVSRLPFSLKILLENLLRREEGETVRAADIEALSRWQAKAAPNREIAFMPARVLMQDFTGVPAVVDLAAMRDAIVELGGDAGRINPLAPAELVIDHSVQVDAFGRPDAFAVNAAREFQRNRERYAFLRWGQKAFANFKVVPPDTGIVHQVNLEYLARVIFTAEQNGEMLAYPDTLVGTDSHTTMINGLGVLGWGVGGIEAEAAMLGQPISMLIPEVLGFRLTGQLKEGATATDLVLTVVQMLRAKGVVGKFVEFFGEGLSHLPLADRATIANMAPEYGATCGIFPIDAETLRYLRLTGRDEAHIKLVETYAKEQGLFRADVGKAEYSDTLTLDLSTVEPSIAGPKRPQDRIPLRQTKQAFHKSLHEFKSSSVKANPTDNQHRFADEGGHTAIGVDGDCPEGISMHIAGADHVLHHGSIVIAAITSCTNTSNPNVMMAAGLLAKKAVERGLTAKPWVKTSLAPGSMVVSEYLQRAGLMPYLEQLGFHLVGYGCTTCIGNSGPLPVEVSKAITAGDLAVCSVLSGNRNFEGRIHSQVKMNYLASPPLVVAYAIAGRMDIDLLHDPLGLDSAGQPVFLRDVWPSQDEVATAMTGSLGADMFRKSYGEVFTGDHQWHALEVPEGERYAWGEGSTYVRQPPYFTGMEKQPQPPVGIQGARALALLGDSVTTDHISPAGAIAAESPAGRYLVEHGVAPADFNSYGSRRGNHEVMMRGTFANIRLRNLLAPGTEGGWTPHQPSGELMSIFDAAMRYQHDKVPTIVIAGKEYGSGSSRDWAAKGPMLLGVRAVIAESYERIHRSNLVGMGVLPLQFTQGENAASLGLSGHETFTISDLRQGAGEATVTADGKSFKTVVRIDTPKEWDYFRHGGILHYVLRQLL